MIEAKEVVICDRCKKVAGEPSHDGMSTAGYYSGWTDFIDPGEEHVCDSCMWADPRYIAIYGPRQDNPPLEFRYGDSKTIHGTKLVNVERDFKTGEVVAVWFSCMSLPFDQHVVAKSRADEMRKMYTERGAKLPIKAVVFEGCP